jgi:hypothetical protein
MSRKITHTTKGVKMSPLMSETWTYLRIERGIPMNDWSTDQCVVRHWDALVAARDAAPNEPVKRYIECIMRRRPCNVVNEGNKRDGKGLSNEASADNWENGGESESSYDDLDNW